MKGYFRYKAIKFFIISFFVILIGFPVLMMISVSFQDMSEIYRKELVFFPQKINFDNYISAMSQGNWGRYIFNSAFISTVSVFVSLFINSMAGFAFSRIPFKGRNFLFVLLLVGMMIPPQVTLIPIFHIIRGIPFAGGNNISGSGGTGLLNTYTGLILPYIAGSFGVFLCRQYFDTFPKELDEAQAIDGCSRFKSFIHVYLPLSKPIFATLGIIKFIGTWNEYTWPLICTPFSDKMRTVQIALTYFRIDGITYYNQLMAATLITSLVVFIPFLFLQKYFTAGFMTGSIKE